MRRNLVIAIIALAVGLIASDANAKLDLYVDKATQRISVVQDDSLLYVWPVSTGRDQFSTPGGVYVPERLERSWFSKEYYNAPMPHAIFFHNGYAIHGSYNISQLGGPASHGCVRLHPQAAALLFAMVQHEGPGNTTILIGGDDAPNRRSQRNREIEMEPRNREVEMEPRNREPDEPVRPPYSMRSPYGDGRTARGASTPEPRTAPYYNRDSYVDGPERRRGDNGQSAMRGDYPVYRPPVRRRDMEMTVEPMPGLRGSYRPPVMAKSNPQCPTCRPGREPVDPTIRRASPSETVKHPGEAVKKPIEFVKLPAAAPPAPAPPAATSSPSASPSPAASTPAASPPPASPPAEQAQPNFGYKVLPKSYWAGASWRWRMKSDPEIH